MAREPHDTDLTDVEWLLPEPLIPPEKHGGRHRTVGWPLSVSPVKQGHEVLPETSEAWICAAMVRIMLQRLARNPAVHL